MAASSSLPDRLAEFQDSTQLHAADGSAVFKCAEVADLGPDEDHGGHEVHVIHWYRGSALILDCPPCVKCGGPMKLVAGIHPTEHPLIGGAGPALHEREDVQQALSKIRAES